ncbi:beta-adaptin [Mycoemilia scoparia]|uniref:AP complex subunit beta n=1 Tax=Mycoemilia scoparia TaxID=417184 RepID=A0A9W8DSS1_9FUNG|nr:beta-adaptin [Mycoemilia scoparia]
MSTFQANLARLQIMKNKVLNVLRKGENFELKTELNSEYRDRRKEAVRRVIANMTVGKDVSGLFTDVLKNMQTEDLEIKKLIYLYLINYAKTKPDLVILAVNTFVRDTEDSNPLIRALSIRTMGCLQVPEVLDYLCDPLSKCLRDPSPYVRKTAVVCVAKIYELDPNVADDYGFIGEVRNALTDSNAMVASNAVISLREISEIDPTRDFWRLDSGTMKALLPIMNECSEWGQITILEALTKYKPRDEREAVTICEQALSRLQHANTSVVLTAIRLIVVYEEYIKNSSTIREYQRKLEPPLVTLLATRSEIQYIALRNLNLVLQKHPEILSKHLKVFYCKYNDPVYVKNEKLGIMVRICSESSAKQLLSELKEYSKEVDVDFVRKSIQAIGQVGVKHQSAADQCSKDLLDIIKTGIEYAVEESITVFRDLYRKYPNRFSDALKPICDCLEIVQAPEAKSALVWIIGEYSQSISQAGKLLEELEPDFLDEEEEVQLALVNSAVKYFLKKPQEGNELVLKILRVASESSPDPDVRDRAYLYWRLLSANPGSARAVALAKKPAIGLKQINVSEDLLKELVSEMGSVASVYHLPSKLFVYQRSKMVGAASSDDIHALRVPHSANGDDESSESQPKEQDMAEEEPEMLISF